MADGEDRPVITGLVALVAVGLVVGLVAGVAALAATQFFGVDEAGGSSADSTAQQSLYLPTPSPTESDDNPLITLAPQSPGSTAKSPAESPTVEKPKKPRRKISLSANQASVSSMERIYLTGTYTRGEGAILMVQRREGKAWEDFGVTVIVRDETFSTYIQSGQTGANQFRLVDTDSKLFSNAVRVTIGG